MKLWEVHKGMRVCWQPGDGSGPYTAEVVGFHVSSVCLFFDGPRGKSAAAVSPSELSLGRPAEAAPLPPAPPFRARAGETAPANAAPPAPLRPSEAVDPAIREWVVSQLQAGANQRTLPERVAGQFPVALGDARVAVARVYHSWRREQDTRFSNAAHRSAVRRA